MNILLKVLAPLFLTISIIFLIFVFLLRSLAVIISIPAAIADERYRYHLNKKKRWNQWIFDLYAGGMKGDHVYDEWKEYRDHV